MAPPSIGSARSEGIIPIIAPPANAAYNPNGKKFCSTLDKSDFHQNLFPSECDTLYICGINTHLKMKGTAAEAYFQAKQIIACRILNLKNHMDMRTLFIVFLFQFSVFYRFKAGPDYFRIPIDVLWLVWLCFVCFCTATITHNCIHNQPFRNYHMNTVWNLLLSHSYGWPVTCLVPGHNLSHHKYTQTPLDAMRTTRMQFKNNWLNYLLFLPSHQAQVIKMDTLYFARSKNKGNVWPYFRLRLEQVCFYPLQLYCFMTFGWQFFWIVFIPQFTAKMGLITMNMLQHDGCLVQKELGETPDEYLALNSHTEITLRKRRTEANHLLKGDVHIDVVKFLRSGEEKRAPTDDEIKNLKIDAADACQKDVEALNEKKLMAVSGEKTNVELKQRSASVDSEDASTRAGTPRSVGTSASVTDSTVAKESEKTNILLLNTGKSAPVTESSASSFEHVVESKKAVFSDAELKELDAKWNPDFNFARDFVGDFANWWFCNNGYHTIHHIRPSLHWSNYAQKHRECIAGKQHPNLAKHNMPYYIYQCLIEGRRETWDGRKYFPNERSYDVNWVDVFFGSDFAAN